MKNKYLIVLADYYKDISKGLLKSAINTLPKSSHIKIIYVPGVFEIPVTISKNIKKYDAFLALGCVIKGKTPHFDFISSASTEAIMQLSINYKKPIGNGIITCLNKKQALDRADPTKRNKGGEAARAVLSVLGIFKDETK
jgi:6,7-dimethyl-8-ribityllumazine synthase